MDEAEALEYRTQVSGRRKAEARVAELEAALNEIWVSSSEARIKAVCQRVLDNGASGDA